MDKPLIEIVKLEARGDIKGAVHNWSVAHFDLVEIPFFYREKGVKPDGHFHKGEDPSFDPQHIIVVHGSLKIIAKDTNNRSEEFVLNSGDMAIIPRLVFHEYETLDYTIFCEPRISEYDPDRTDKYPWDEFLQLQS